MKKYALLTTPFRADGTFDSVSFGRYIEYLSDLDMDGIGILGPVGESPLMNKKDKEQVLVTARQAAGSLEIGYSIYNNSVEEAKIELHTACKGGADFFLVIPPSFLATSGDLLITYYSLLARECTKDLYVLNIPRSVGCFLSANDLEKLVSIKEVSGICDVSGKGIVRQRLVKKKRYFEGHAPSLLESSVWEIKGIMTVTMGLFPELHLAFFHYLTAGNLQKAREGQNIITRLSSLVHLPGRPVCVGAKYLLSLKGVCEASVKPPLAEPTIAEKQQIKSELAILKEEISKY